jgi:hypothetical protein
MTVSRPVEGAIDHGGSSPYAQLPFRLMPAGRKKSEGGDCFRHTGQDLFGADRESLIEFNPTAQDVLDVQECCELVQENGSDRRSDTV